MLQLYLLHCGQGCGEGSVSHLWLVKGALIISSSHCVATVTIPHDDGFRVRWGRGGKGLCFIRAMIKPRMIKDTERTSLIEKAMNIHITLAVCSRLA